MSEQHDNQPTWRDIEKKWVGRLAYVLLIGSCVGGLAWALFSILISKTVFNVSAIAAVPIGALVAFRFPEQFNKRRLKSVAGDIVVWSLASFLTFAFAIPFVSVILWGEVQLREFEVTGSASGRRANLTVADSTYHGRVRYVSSSTARSLRDGGLIRFSVRCNPLACWKGGDARGSDRQEGGSDGE